jgi:hypothetical protein
MMEVLHKRPDSWRKRFVSFEERIVLINSVLGSMLIFNLSFLKILVKVWRIVVKAQKSFFRVVLEMSKIV